MSSASNERILSSDELDEVLKSGHLTGAHANAWPVLVVSADPLRVIWANRAATLLFGTTDADALSAQLFAAGGRSRLADDLRRLPGNVPPSLDRFRLAAGLVPRVVTLSLSLCDLGEGRVLYGVAVPGPNPASAEPSGIPASALVCRDEESRPGGESQDAPAGLATACRHHGSMSDQGAADDRSATSVKAPEAKPAGLSRRFLWRTDAHHRVTDISGGLPGLFGMTGEGLRGRSFPDVMKELGCDPDGRLRAAFESEATWSGFNLLWRLDDSELTVRTQLGAVPVLGPAQQFAGYRGFGTIDPAPVESAPAAATPNDGAAAPSEGESAFASPLRGVEPRSPEPETLVPDQEPAVVSADNLDGVVPAAKPGSQTKEPHSSGSKVIALRPYSVVPHGEGQSGPANRRGTDRAREPRAAGNPSHLSMVERFAFQEIARALGARLEGEEVVADPKPSLEPELAPVVPASRPEPPLAGAEPPVAGAEGGEEFSGRPAGESPAALLDVLPNAYLVCFDGQPHHANRAFAELTGYGSAADLAEAGGLIHLLGGLNPHQVMDQSSDRAFPIIDAAGQVVAVEGRMDAIDWASKPASVLTLRRSGDKAATLQSLEFEVKRHQTDLAEAQAMLDAVSEAVATVDAGSRLLTLNRAGQQMFGCAPSQAAGETLESFLSPDSRAALAAMLADVRDGKAAAGTDVTGRGAGGALPLHMTVLRIGTDKLCAIWRSRAAETGSAHNHANERPGPGDTSAFKSDFLAKVSHEIRTPLNAILGFAEVILDERFGPIGNDRYKDYLRDIHDSGTHVMSLMNDLLDLSRMEAGQLGMNVAAVDANRIVSDCVNQMQPNAHRERVIMRLSLPPRLPAVLVDERAFRQIMLNLLSNAVKFNEPGGQVIVSTAANGGEIAVRVRDTGIGMSDQEIAMAMEPFRQITTSKPKGGNGLGLSLAKALVEANHASMTIKSRKHEGTLVEIVLRAAPADAMRVPAA